MNRKGIILAGGKGTRLYPLTLAVTKCLLPIYDKPMIYYSLSTLMLADIKDILIISTPDDKSIFSHLLGDGSTWGINITYEVQLEPKGIAEALIIADKFVGSDHCALMLADNIFYGEELEQKLMIASNSSNNTVFAYQVDDPERFGVCDVNGSDNKVLSIEEKPLEPKSNLAVTGLYFYDADAANIAKNIKPSSRGELEITDVNIEYMKANKLFCEILGKGYAWIDAGTNESFLEASNFVKHIEKIQGLKIACPEEVSFNKNWISSEQVNQLANKYKNSDYGKYLKKLIN